MKIIITKQQPGSWERSRRPLTLEARLPASDWDGLFNYANENGRSVQGIMREALREWLNKHCTQARTDEVRITVSGTGCGSSFIGKLVQSIVGGAGGKHSAAEAPNNSSECGRR